MFNLGLPGVPFDIVEKTIKFFHFSEPDYASVSGFLPAWITEFKKI